jgi:hypothetical protein
MTTGPSLAFEHRDVMVMTKKVRAGKP